MCIGTVAELSGLYQDVKYEYWKPATGGPIILSVEVVADKFGNNDFCVRGTGYPGYFVIGTAESASIHVYPDFHRYVHYHKNRK